MSFTTPFALSLLNGANGFRLNAPGWAVAAVGDMNGDGFADVIVGARDAPDKASGPGSSYVVFGRADGWASTIEVSSLDGSNGFRLEGWGTNNLTGTSVAGAGDVNGDGFADLILATSSNTLQASASAAQVLFGKATGWTASFGPGPLDGRNGFRFEGMVLPSDGLSVASAGDVNGDGFDDVIVCARGAFPNGHQSGASHILFGKSSGLTVTDHVLGLNGTTGFSLQGVAVGDRSGTSVASAGDVNGDGFADLIVGAPNADPNGSGSGSSYVVFGKAGGWASRIELSALNGSDGFRLDGAAGEASGIAVASAGDVNGDGFADLLIGAYGANAGYVVFGKAGTWATAINLSALDGTNGFQLARAAAGDNAGGSLAAAGDVNGDGYGDLIIGAPSAAPNGIVTGASYVVFGKPDRWDAVLQLSALDGDSGVRLDGRSTGEQSGYSVAGAGDVNGDGLADLIIAAPSPSRFAGAGSTYVVFSPFEARSEVMFATRGVETLNGGGGDDVLYGSTSGADTLNGGAGNDTYQVNAIGTVVMPGGGTDHAFITVDGWTPPAGLWASYLAGSASQISGGTRADQLVANASLGSLLSGGAGNDTLWGQAGADTLNADAGRDILRGGAGNDVLTGGAGNDQLVGGAGADVFTFSSADDGYDQIFDFSRAEGDLIRIAYAGGPADFAALTIRDIAGNTKLLFGTTRIDIYGVTGMAAGDFLFV